MSKITIWQALARCALTTHWAVNMCDNFCANMYGYAFSGYTDAVAHWNHLPAADKHPGDDTVPPGMLAFWGGGHGHVAVSDGTGYVWSTDISGAGTVSRVPLGLVASRWGKPYLGWGEPMFQGIAWSETVPRVMRDSTNPADIPLAGTDLVAGYLNGSYAWSAAGWARFPDAGHVTIDVNGTRPDADVLDVEPGDATVAGGVRWLPKALAVSRDFVPVIYCNRSNRTAFVTAAKTAGFSINTHYKFWVATLDGTRTLSDMTGVAAIQWAGAGQTGHHYDQSDVFDDTWKATDMPLTTADKAWISAEFVKQLKAVVYGQVWDQDKMPAPDTAPDKATNANQLPRNVVRSTYDLANTTEQTARAVLAQAETIGVSLSEIKATLAALDLSQLPAEIAARLETLKLNVTVSEV